MLSLGHMRSWASVSSVSAPATPVLSSPLNLASDGADTFISKTTRLYKDSRTLTQGAGGSSAPPSQLDQLNENLQDVTRIMTKNMEDLLWRGDSLDRESSRVPSCRLERGLI